MFNNAKVVQLDKKINLFLEILNLKSRLYSYALSIKYTIK